ncbi:hypothetical protein Nm8I071_22720 [Nonomuraea sp. TT08I-71]|nr:hypothetical protein Nm8I071_22720 [Nonomuraea sp. TT08I-71]
MPDIATTRPGVARRSALADIRHHIEAESNRREMESLPVAIGPIPADNPPPVLFLDEPTTGLAMCRCEWR